VLNVLKRGFALVKNASGQVIQSAAAMPAEGTLMVQFHDGERMVSSGGGSAPKPRAKKTHASEPGLFD
jgi:exodeoxyribonuclease VII large subunit